VEFPFIAGLQKSLLINVGLYGRFRFLGSGFRASDWISWIPLFRQTGSKPTVSVILSQCIIFDMGRIIDSGCDCWSMVCFELKHCKRRNFAALLSQSPKYAYIFTVFLDRETFCSVVRRCSRIYLVCEIVNVFLKFWVFTARQHSLLCRALY